ncbi:hypothetical protein [Methanococcus aeolicus]|uniref:hypothetical protein n=1 Tax=Methanococcus aeolicus TaxID=42879 RepID=UPI0021C77698|nr:hypothetical protein [Methanococcus aeolicus]UXM84810.1 hypothetical protein N6C89_00485 [Methanococcus aeolicus]
MGLQAMHLIVLFISLLIGLELIGQLKRKYLVNKLISLKKELKMEENNNSENEYNKNLIKNIDDKCINLISEDKLLDTKEVRRSLTIIMTILYIYTLFEPVDEKIFSSVQMIFGIVIAFYFGSRAIEGGLKIYEKFKKLK